METCIKQAGFDKIILAVVLLSNGQGQPLMGASTASAVHQELHQGVRTDRQTDRQMDGHWHPHQTAHRMQTDSIYCLNFL